MAVDKNGKKLPVGIRRKPSGKYEVRVKREGETHYAYAETLTEAKKKKAELEFKLDQGIFVEKKKIKFEDWFYTWLQEYKKNQVKNSTYNSYMKYYRGAIKRRIGGKKITDIRGEHIQKLYNDLVKEGYAISSIKIVSAVLNGCFKQAERNGLIERNPVKLAELPRQTEKKTRQAMTREQQALFMEYAKESYLYHFFAVMLRTGMRKGDADGKISLNQQKPSKHAGLRRFGPEKFLQRNNEFMKERPIFYKKPIKTEKDFSTWLRCFYYTTKAVITEYIYF